MRIDRESITTVITTGVTSTTITATKSISRAILLPKRIRTDFIYDLSFVAANKNFTYGGYFGRTDRFVIVDAKDLGTFVIDKESDVCVISNRRYTIKEVEEYDEAGKIVLYILTLVDLESQPDVQS
jgi:hypothetical protein